MVTDMEKAGETYIIRFIVEEKFRLHRHIVLLLGVLVVISCSDQLLEYSGSNKYYRVLFVHFMLIAMSYLNMYYLVPRFFFKGRYVYYLLLLIVLVLIGMALMSVTLNSIFIKEEWKARQPMLSDKRGLYEGTVILIPIILVTTMIKLFQRWVKDRERMTEIQQLQLTLELNVLRNQINPHFLFNMLTGIKALTWMDPEKAAMVIVKLSEFLRYQLYGTNQEKTTLSSELNFLRNFLELEKIRRDDFTVEVITDIAPDLLNSIVLPPNLFTTFVENAVKHSADISGNGSFIRVSLALSEQMLHFTCINSKDASFKHPDPQNSGLGLGNITRHLSLLYGNAYKLAMQSSETEYCVQLKLPV